jgi:hypothetical protein
MPEPCARKPGYRAWIEANVPDPVGACAEATLAMLGAFPDLKRVRGHYYCPAWGQREHWWLVTADGTIIDPTAHQFPSLGAGLYVPWDEDRVEPTGICANCGDYVFGGGTCCSQACNRAYAAYCMNPHLY